MMEIHGDFGKRFVEVAGGRIELNDIEEVIRSIEDIDESNETVSQLFDASCVAGSDHLFHSVRLALDALERDRAFANSSRIEFTCWVAGLRQINKSLDCVGISEETESVAVLIVGQSSSKVEKSLNDIFDQLDIERMDEVLEIDDKKFENLLDIYSIDESRAGAFSLKDLILEKVALLSLEQ